MSRISPKTFISATFFIFTFAFGVSFTSITVLQERPIPPIHYTSLCEATKNHYFSVYLTGNIYAHYQNGRKILYFSDIKSNSCQTGHTEADIMLADEQNLTIESQNLIEEIRQLTKNNNIARAKVKVIGTLVRRPHITGAETAYVLEATKITAQNSVEVISDSDFRKEIMKSSN